MHGKVGVPGRGEQCVKPVPLERLAKNTEASASVHHSRFVPNYTYFSSTVCQNLSNYSHLFSKIGVCYWPLAIFFPLIIIESRKHHSLSG